MRRQKTVTCFSRGGHFFPQKARINRNAVSERFLCCSTPILTRCNWQADSALFNFTPLVIGGTDKYKQLTNGQLKLALKGQCHEIFCFWFFSWISFPQAPDYTIRDISNFFENSRRYSQPPVSVTPVANGKNLQSENLLWFLLDTFG
jgi:hypothetical protein